MQPPTSSSVTSSFACHHGVHTIFFSIYQAATFATLGPVTTVEVPVTWPSLPADLISQAPWIPFPTSITFRRYEAGYFYLPNSTGVSDIACIRAVVAGADTVIVRSCTELEPDFLRVLPELFHMPVLPIGLLWPDDADGGGGKVTELAMGLEMSGLPFIWAYRDGPESLQVGFEEQVMGGGMVVWGWAPQLSILAHRAVGGFLAHLWDFLACGGCGQGKLLVGLPMTVDQGLNCRAMVVRGFGVEVNRDEISGSYTREDVSKAVRLVLVEEAGGPIKKVFSSNDWNQAFVDKLVHFLEEDLLSRDIQN